MIAAPGQRRASPPRSLTRRYTDSMIRTALVIALIFGLTGCMTESTKIELCEEYVRSYEVDRVLLGSQRSSAEVDGAGTVWTLRSKPPELQSSAALPLPREFDAVYQLEDMRWVWFSNGSGDSGLCAVDVSDRAAVAFFVYRGSALTEEPAEGRITGGPCGEESLLRRLTRFCS